MLILSRDYAIFPVRHRRRLRNYRQPPLPDTLMAILFGIAVQGYFAFLLVSLTVAFAFL